MDIKSEDVVLKYLLEKQSKHRGNDICLISANTNEEITYYELFCMANRVGHALKTLNIKKGDKVATMIVNSLEAIYAWYGCATIGAVEVPINNAYKGNMLSYILNNSKTTILIVESSFLNRIKDIQHQLEFIEEVIVIREEASLSNLIQFPSKKWEDFIKASPTTPHTEKIYYWDIIHMIYTSGTTGPSKGVLCTYLQMYETSVPTRLIENNCYYVYLPLNHIAGRIYTYLGLLYGEQVVIRDRFSTSRFWPDVKRFQCTTTLLLNTTANFLYKEPPNPNDGNNPLRHTRMNPPIPEVEDFKRRFKVEVSVGFNMTEICSPIVSPGFPDFNVLDKSCIGKVRSGFEARIVNDYDEEVAYGEIGELVIRSDKPWSLMAGYWEMPDKTLETFRNLWLHTGDLAYRDEEGYFYFVDRKKDAIRRRGENISSAEVEKEVDSHPKVLEVAAVGVPSEWGEEEIKIVVVEKSNESIDPEELLHYLIPRMPHFMVPRYIEIVPELPKTATNKVQKSKLREQGITEKTWDREKAGIKVGFNSK